MSLSDLGSLKMLALFLQNEKNEKLHELIDLRY